MRKRGARSERVKEEMNPREMLRMTPAPSSNAQKLPVEPQHPLHPLEPYAFAVYGT
jgi:hypothetical protein